MQYLHSLYISKFKLSILKEEFLMASLQENFVKQVDVVWDVYLSNFKTVLNFQDGIQQKALQALSYQKELLDSSLKTLNSIEEESKKLSKDITDKVQDNVKQISNSEDEQVSKWLKSIEDITESLQLFSLKPSQSVLDVFIESQNQLEAITKKVLATHKKERTEYIKKVEELIEQVKTTQKELLNPSKA